MIKSDDFSANEDGVFSLAKLLNSEHNKAELLLEGIVDALTLLFERYEDDAFEEAGKLLTMTAAAVSKLCANLNNYCKVVGVWWFDN